jgi:A/G-specific adenine glycosylase
MIWQDSLLEWYESHRRDLPWRNLVDAYPVWVSEIMLQQTQVATVIPYWRRWMERFPTVESLAAADEQDVLSLWQGLGYYRRCRMLLEGARFVAAHGAPQGADEWRHVPGVGAYTAGAIASIAQGHPAALVDGNVERVYARLTGDAASGPALNRNAWEWARANIRQDQPGNWNQALMELGATLCTPTKPRCLMCPVMPSCVANATGQVEKLPAKVSKPKAISLAHVVWIPLFDGQVGVRQIPAGSWWAGMWEFPRIDVTDLNRGVEGHVDVATDGGTSLLRNLVGSGTVRYVGEVRHSVTHHRISIRVHLAGCESQTEALSWRSPEALADLPMPSPQQKILKLAWTSLLSCAT